MLDIEPDWRYLGRADVIEEGSVRRYALADADR